MNNITHQHDGTDHIKASSWIARTAGATLTLGALLGIANHAAAVDFPLDLPAGQACSFDLRIDSVPAPNRVFKQFADKKGGSVKILEAGQGNRVTFTNLISGSTYLMNPSGGSVNHTTKNPDGTSTTTLTGHNTLILFPTDIPAGPTTTLYIGKVVYTSTATNDFTLVSTSGRKVDICAALGG